MCCAIVAKKDTIFYLLDEGDVEGARYQFTRVYIFPNGEVDEGFAELKKERDAILLAKK